MDLHTELVAVIIYLLAMLPLAFILPVRAKVRIVSLPQVVACHLGSWFSIYATTLSAITFMSTPEKAFLTDWSYIAGNIAIVAIIPLLIYFYVPFFKS